jgi:hypothetical protein
MRSLALALLLTGCVSISDIDTSRVERVCAVNCANNYSFCVSPSGALVPRAINNYQCKEGYSACIKACPLQ